MADFEPHVREGPPHPDEIEVSIFGRGTGEALAVHIGSNRWIAIDSCLDPESCNPAIVEYFNKLGIDPNCIELVVASHWDDDHIRGLSEVLLQAPDARFCMSAALDRQEFVSFVKMRGMDAQSKIRFGARELSKIIGLIEERLSSQTYNKTLELLTANTRFLRIPAADLSHGLPCEIWSISPSTKQLENFYLDVAQQRDVVGKTRRRIPVQKRNHLSIVIQLIIGEISLLFGGDLEERGDPDTGWTAIVESAARPADKSCIFKVPHHGSVNGHHDRVWDRMLTNKPTALIAPFHSLAEPLPTPLDVERIVGLTPEAYSAASTRKPRFRHPDRTIARRVSERPVKVVSFPPKLGTVTVRMRTNGEMRVLLQDPAIRLEAN